MWPTESKSRHSWRNGTSSGQDGRHPVASCFRAWNSDWQLTGPLGSSNLQETRIHARMQRLEIHQREEVNRLELLIDGGWTTDLRPNRQVRAQQLRDHVACVL